MQARPHLEQARPHLEQAGSSSFQPALIDSSSQHDSRGAPTCSRNRPCGSEPQSERLSQAQRICGSEPQGMEPGRRRFDSGDSPHSWYKGDPRRRHTRTNAAECSTLRRANPGSRSQTRRRAATDRRNLSSRGSRMRPARPHAAELRPSSAIHPSRARASADRRSNSARARRATACWTSSPDRTCAGAST